MSLACPSCNQALVRAQDGSHICHGCHGIWQSLHSFAGLHLEDDAQAPAHARSLSCPSCKSVLAPWRIGADPNAYLHRCQSCEQDFIGNRERSAIERAQTRAAAESAYASFSKDDRRGIRDAVVASMVRDPDAPPRSNFILRILGLPQIHYRRVRVPIVTPLFALALLLIFAFVDTEPWTYVAREDGIGAAFTSIFVHADAWHLIGSLYFLLVFGIGAESKVPRLVFLAWMLFGGTLGTLAEGWLYPEAVVLGASGAIAVAIGMCIVLLRKTRVTISVMFIPIPLSMLGFGVIEVLFQLGSALFGREGVAWFAHLVGLGVGGALGLAAFEKNGGRKGERKGRRKGNEATAVTE